jgi:hypothetical protein
MDYLCNTDLPTSDIINNYINYLRVLRVVPTLTLDHTTLPNLDSNHTPKYKVGIDFYKDPTPINSIGGRAFKCLEFYFEVYKHGNTHFLRKFYTFENIDSKGIVNDTACDIEVYITHSIDYEELQPEILYYTVNSTVSVSMLINLDKVISEGSWWSIYYLF